MGDTTTSTKRLWAEIVARFTAEPEPEPPKRGSLCSILGTHDRGPDGRCRDCTKPLTDADEVCRDVPMGGPIQGVQR